MDGVTSMVISLAGLGRIPGYIARRKGYSFGIWWLYGALAPVAALPHSIFLKPADETHR